MNNIISEIIIRLKNGARSKKDVVAIPYTNFANAVLETLKRAGYIDSITKKGKKVVKTVDVGLRYIDGVSVITDVKQISKPSKRLYSGSAKLHPVKRGAGNLIISTSKGIMTGQEAKKEKLGGELLFEIW